MSTSPTATATGRRANMKTTVTMNDKKTATIVIYNPQHTPGADPYQS
jgi:hypothetical protein